MHESQILLYLLTTITATWCRIRKRSVAAGICTPLGSARQGGSFCRSASACCAQARSRKPGSSLMPSVLCACRSWLECLRKSSTSARSHAGNMKLHQGQAETKCSAAASTKKGTTRQGARQRWQRSWHCEPRRSHAGNIRAKRSEAALNKPAGQGPGPVKPNLKVRAMQLCNAAHRKLQREAANCKCKPCENASEGSFATGAAAPTVSDGANTWSGLVFSWSCDEA